MKSIEKRTNKVVSSFLKILRDDLNAQFENFNSPSSDEDEGFFSSFDDILSDVELSIPAALGGRIKFTTSRNLN
jgi:hypothetical protein